MNQTKKIVVVIGTRPEAIKLAPVVHAIEQCEWARCEVLLTGQHRDLIEPIVKHFNLKVTHDLEAMQPNQSLAGVTAKILQGVDTFISTRSPDAVLGQGDTASVLATSMACFFRHIPFAHVEAGLRTGNLHLPFPEEMNRVLTTQMAHWHFAPTVLAKNNLLAEGVDPQKIWVTGNTVIDALKLTIAQAAPPLPCRPGREFVLITAHRRENMGTALESVCNAIAVLAQLHPELDFIYPVHPNPGIRLVVHKLLANMHNVLLIEPCNYAVFCCLMSRARLILSDSGGVQEEAPFLGKPVLVLRDETERPEALAIGANELVGTRMERIVMAAQALLLDAAAYERMATAGSPYGDGHAATLIVDTLRQSLGCQIETREEVLL
jgi:UDP-N-acetylglucosamine 2-epimerase (non-hydrolysing)